jgi:hypothetical protein
LLGEEGLVADLALLTSCDGFIFLLLLSLSLSLAVLLLLSDGLQLSREGRYGRTGFCDPIDGGVFVLPVCFNTTDVGFAAIGGGVVLLMLGFTSTTGIVFLAGLSKVLVVVVGFGCKGGGLDVLRSLGRGGKNGCATFGFGLSAGGADFSLSCFTGDNRGVVFGESNLTLVGEAEVLLLVVEVLLERDFLAAADMGLEGSRGIELLDSGTAMLFASNVSLLLLLFVVTGLFFHVALGL